MTFLGSARFAVKIGRDTVIVVAGIFLLMCTAWADTAGPSRPETWAQPVPMEGVANLYRVSDELYRGDQPSALGMQNLRKLGIKTIVNLRWLHSDRSKIGDLEAEMVHIYMKAWHPEEEDAVRFLQIVTDRKRTPVMVHCHYGADRTGVMVALYRIAVQGWSKEEAIREMTTGGFGFHQTWGNLPKWIQKLNIDDLKRKAGIAGDKPETNQR